MENDLDIQIASEVGRIYNELMSIRKDSDYVINPGQMEKFLDLVRFFNRRLIRKTTASVEVEELKPKMTSGGVTAKFVLFDVHGEMVSEFCRVLSACSVIQIMLGNECVMISCTVPDVFVRKSK